MWLSQPGIQICKVVKWKHRDGEATYKNSNAQVKAESARPGACLCTGHEKHALGVSTASQVPAAAKALAPERVPGKAGPSGWRLPPGNGAPPRSGLPTALPPWPLERQRPDHSGVSVAGRGRPWGKLPDSAQTLSHLSL